ncbi:hypothetical protein LC55x_3799 [Lysobacter capsici]|nr:hypothetical protein LC55x_3799 [Lysobacter capsici]
MRERDGVFPPRGSACAERIDRFKPTPRCRRSHTGQFDALSY